MPRIRLTPREDAASALPSKSELAEISSVSKAGRASKSREFMLAMSSMIFTFISSSMDANWQVGGRQSFTIRSNIFPACCRSQKPWHPIAF
eukprot:Skav212892  [mRNA]  locus=scaffold374:12850:13729:- [translate_table: standard]